MICEFVCINYPIRSRSVRVGWDWGFAFMHYGDRWKQHRRDFHHFFLPTACLGYHNKLLKTSRGLLRDLLDKPDDFFSHIR